MKPGCEDAGSYFDHDADVGIIGRGSTLEQAFESAARAMFGVMVDLAAVRNESTVHFDFEEPDVELALVTWLNLILAHARESQMVFGHFHVQREGNAWHCDAGGKRWEREMERGTEVKGATLTMLSVKQNARGWEARCVVDV
jgi:SHS2 domain-containing protein